MIKVENFQEESLYDLTWKINEFGKKHKIVNIALSSTDYFAGYSKCRNHYALVMYEDI